jgi:Putative auto-transporter adhesin, head GIN domain
MKYLLHAAVVAAAMLLAGAADAQTSVIQQNSTSTPGSIQQNNVSINGGDEGSSVTVSGGAISVDITRSGGRVVGDGQPASEDRPIGPVEAIHSDGAFALRITIGPAPKLTIEADKNILPIIKTRSENGRLDIYSDRSYSVNRRIMVTVSLPNVSDISASGSNQIQADGFAGGPLSVSLDGSNHAVLAGRVAALTCVLSGANHLAAQGLAAGSANVALNGSGDAAVDASQRIVANISGAGTITISGNPKERSTEVNGAGRINFVQ